MFNAQGTQVCPFLRTAGGRENLRADLLCQAYCCQPYAAGGVMNQYTLSSAQASAMDQRIIGGEKGYGYAGGLLKGQMRGFRNDKLRGRNGICCHATGGQGNYLIANLEIPDGGSDACNHAGAFDPERTRRAVILDIWSCAHRSQHIEKIEAGGIDLDLYLICCRRAPLRFARDSSIQQTGLIDLQPISALFCWNKNWSAPGRLASLRVCVVMAQTRHVAPARAQSKLIFWSGVSNLPPEGFQFRLLLLLAHINAATGQVSVFIADNASQAPKGGLREAGNSLVRLYALNSSGHKPEARPLPPVCLSQRLDQVEHMECMRGIILVLLLLGLRPVQTPEIDDSAIGRLRIAA